IAVGMATNMAPHNPGEVIAACAHLIRNPDAGLAELMRFIPGPDLPTGGRIIGLDGVREAYETGRGTFRTRATVSFENISARRKGIVVTELPYLVGPEKVVSKVKDAVAAKKLTGIASIDDYSDRKNGMRLVIGIKNGFNPEAVLAELYRQTPLEESFGINNVCLVDGPARPDHGLPHPPHRRRPPPHGVPAAQGQGPAPPRRGSAHRDPRHRRGHPAHPLLRVCRQRQDASDGGLRPLRAAGHLHPRPAAASTHEVLPPRARSRTRRAEEEDRLPGIAARR